MGFQTPFMILNDAIDMLNKKEYQSKFCEDLFHSACGMDEKSKTISVGNFCNPVEVLRPIHADCQRILYCGRNSFFDIGDIEVKEIRESIITYKCLVKLLKGVIVELEEKINTVEKNK